MRTGDTPFSGDTTPPSFRARLVQVTAEVVHVAVRGEVDTVTRDVLAEAIERACTTSPVLVVVDLTEAEFLSVSAVAVLIRARAAAAERGVTMAATGRPGMVRWVLGFMDRLPAAIDPAA
jgi:anti-anti-sigma factor